MNRQSLIFGVPMLALLGLTGCAGQSRTLSCAQDWEQLGYKLAEKGESVREYKRYEEQCGDQIGEAEKDAYLDGWARGIVKYCTFDTAYEIGLENREYPEACPYELRSVVDRGYALGKQEYKGRVAKMQARDAHQDREDESRTARQGLRGDGGAN